jgi:hypothetical protein
MTDPHASTPLGNPKQPALPPGVKLPMGAKKGPGVPFNGPPKRSISMVNSGAANAAVTNVSDKPTASVRHYAFLFFRCTVLNSFIFPLSIASHRYKFYCERLLGLSILP